MAYQNLPICRHAHIHAKQPVSVLDHLHGSPLGMQTASTSVADQSIAEVCKLAYQRIGDYWHDSASKVTGLSHTQQPLLMLHFCVSLTDMKTVHDVHSTKVPVHSIAGPQYTFCDALRKHCMGMLCGLICGFVEAVCLLLRPEGVRLQCACTHTMMLHLHYKSPSPSPHL